MMSTPAHIGRMQELETMSRSAGTTWCPVGADSLAANNVDLSGFGSFDPGW